MNDKPPNAESQVPLPDRDNWFTRIAIDVIESQLINEQATAADWRVLHAICKRQGFNDRKTYALYLAKVAESAFCSRVVACRAIKFWIEVRALIKTKKDRRNVFEIATSLPPDSELATTRPTRKQKTPDRDSRGRMTGTSWTKKPVKLRKR